MEYLPLVFAGLLSGACIVCSIAEFLLRLFKRESPVYRGASTVQPSEQEGEALTGLLAENSRRITQPTSRSDAPQKPGILIADDHRLYRRTLETWFQEHGFVVWLAADGREAVALHCLHAKDIGLALLDVWMPELDGPETLAVLRQETPSLPCCFMTASLAAGQEAKLLALGAARVYEKPILLREATPFMWGLIDQVSSGPERTPENGSRTSSSVACDSQLNLRLSADGADQNSPPIPTRSSDS